MDFEMTKVCILIYTLMQKHYLHGILHKYRFKVLAWTMHRVIPNFWSI